MKRHLAMRDRVVWVVALAAVALLVYLLVPVWITVLTIVLVLGGSLLVSRSRRRARG